MNYTYSEIYDEEKLNEVPALDGTVYAKKFTGTFSSVSDRYKKNPEMFIFATDENNELSGYISFFPISGVLVAKLDQEQVMFDDNITAADVLPYKKDMINHIFIISLVVSPKYRRQGIAFTLVQNMFKLLRKKREANYHIGNIYATTISKASESLFKQFAFTEKHPYKANIKLLELSPFR